MAQFGFGIVGCGMIAHFHARAIADLPNGRLVAVQTSDPAKMPPVAQAAGRRPEEIAVYTDLAEMLRRPDLDIVCICTPSGAHLEPAAAAAAAGKHVVVEKPLEITLDRCDRLIEACDRAGVKLAAIFPSRFTDVNQTLKAAVEGGRFGRLVVGDTTVKWWRPQSYYDSGKWRGTWELDGGGALMNQAIHNVDLLQYMMGPVRQIAAFTGLLAHERIAVEDTAVAALHFANGAMGTLTATTSVFPGLLKTIAIHGDQGSAVVEQDSLLTWKFAHETPADDAVRARFSASSAVSGGASDPKAISHEPHARQLADFVRSLETGHKPLVDGADGRKAVEIILAIYQSQATGQVVTLPLPADPPLPQLRRG